MLRWSAIFVIFVGACAVTCKGINSTSVAKRIDVDVKALSERARAWLWSQRNKDTAGWGNDTHTVLLALRLANLSQDNHALSIPLELQLSSKQMELEIVLMLWRHKELGFSAAHLAKYTLALNALCSDPRQFHGHDLIGTLQHHEPPSDLDFAFMALAACSAESRVRPRQLRRLYDIANVSQHHNLETMSMVFLALGCIVQDHGHRNFHHLVRRASVRLAERQKPDGSFGDVQTTALVMQALTGIENEQTNGNKSAALMWLAAQQKSDGSFAEDVYTTAQVVLAVLPRGLTSIRSLDCGKSSNKQSPAHLVPNYLEETTSESHENVIPSSTPSAPITAANSTDFFTDVPTTEITRPMVNVSYTLWFGDNETYHLTVTAPKNETFYGVMLVAAEMSPHFEFAASEWPNGHYVHTIAGYKEDPMSYHYWLLYRLPSPPDRAAPPGNQLVAPGGVDDLEISQGEHYLFWYKKL